MSQIGSGGYDAVNQIGTSGGHGVKGYAGPFSKMEQHGGKKLTSLTVAGHQLSLDGTEECPMKNVKKVSCTL